MSVRANILNAVAVLSQVALASVHAQERLGDGPLTRLLQMNACYVKEDRDRAWQIRIVGNLPHGPGVYVIVYNEAGDIVHQSSAPYGAHPPEKPYLIEVPEDGKAQQYVIKLLGPQKNLKAISLPLTDLPHEVYGDTYFSFGGNPASGPRRIVGFQPPSNGQPIHFSGYKGDYRILDDTGQIIADSKDKVAVDSKGRNSQPAVTMVLPLPAGKTFWIEPYQLNSLSLLEGKLYLTFDPQRWFEPKLAWTLDTRPWWKGTVP
jgi:hypothetical protein